MPCFYSSPEWPNQTLVLQRAFLIKKQKTSIFQKSFLTLEWLKKQQQVRLERWGHQSIFRSHPKSIMAVLGDKQQRNATMFCFWSAISTSSTAAMCNIAHTATVFHNSNSVSWSRLEKVHPGLWLQKTPVSVKSWNQLIQKNRRALCQSLPFPAWVE